MTSVGRQTQVVYASGVNLNQAQNTVLLTFRVIKPVRLHRYGVIADAAAGLLAAMDLKLRHIPEATGTAADISGTQLNGAVVARGSGIVKTLGSRLEYAVPGDEIVIAVETAAGGTSTGDVFLEYEEGALQIANTATLAESA